VCERSFPNAAVRSQKPTCVESCKDEQKKTPEARPSRRIMLVVDEK